MTEIFRPPYMQVETSAGVPVSGAKLYFYQAGTTTAITIYQDSGKTTPHANPVIADASGRFAAIYVDESTYKVVLKDADDVTLQSFDNINGTSTSTGFVDSEFRITGNLDATKALAFQVDAIAAGNTRTLTIPDTDGTIFLTSQLATPEEAIAGTSTTKAVTPAGLYYPAGHLYGLTLSNGSDATNDIDIAPGTARNHLDTANIDLITGLTKQMDASWAVGDDAGGCFSTASDTTWHVYLIKRPDTGVVDVGFSTDASDPTGDANYPSDYTIFRRIGYFVRASGANGVPVWLGPEQASGKYFGIQLGTAQASTSGTAIDFTDIPAGTKRITVELKGVSTSGSSAPIIQLGDSGGIETSGYVSTAINAAGSVSAGSSTVGIALASNWAASSVFSGAVTLTLLDPAANSWVSGFTASRDDGAVAIFGGGSKALSATLDRIRLTVTNGSDTFDAGSVNILYE